LPLVVPLSLTKELSDTKELLLRILPDLERLSLSSSGSERMLFLWAGLAPSLIELREPNIFFQGEIG